MNINQVLAQEFHLRQEQIDQTVALIDEGATIPFIARYRKERTGSLDDQVLREIFDRLNYLRNLEKRKEEIQVSITEQDKMTEELAKAIDAAKTLVEVEDLYRQAQDPCKRCPCTWFGAVGTAAACPKARCGSGTGGSCLCKSGAGGARCTGSLAGGNGHSGRGYFR